MGRNQHSKDRIYITATEWAHEYGGKKRARNTTQRQLPFDSCALSLQQFETPVCTTDGVVFDILHIVPFLKKHKCNPLNSEPMRYKDLIHLNMAKNAAGRWHCPVTFKTFTDNSKVVFVRTTGNVYAWEAVEQLNIKAKNWKDLLTEEPFKRSDIISIQDPSDAELCARRDISNFSHLKTMRDEAASERASEKSSDKIRATPSQSALFAEISASREQQKADDRAKAAQREEALLAELDDIPDLKAIRMLKPTAEDLNPGTAQTDGGASYSLTSSGVQVATEATLRPATVDEIRQARWKCMRKLGKKGYVQVTTNFGNLNLEIHCDFVPKTAENFLGLCAKGNYDGLSFHRLIPGFMLQGGCPEGNGTGGVSLWGEPFTDEFDSRLVHNGRGVVSMANSGPNTNRSQFFICFRACRHLDNAHAIFGKVVGGSSVLDRIERVPRDKNDKPTQEVKIIRTTVFTNPIEEATTVLEGLIRERQEAKQGELSKRSKATGGQQAAKPQSMIEAEARAKAGDRKGWFSNATPSGESASSSSSGSGGSGGGGIGKYMGAGAANTTLAALPPSSSSASSSSSSSSKAKASSNARTASEAAWAEEPVQTNFKRKKVVAKTTFGNFDSW